jgi:hypothetical protein
VIVVVTNSIQPAFTGISSFFFVTDQNITLTIGLVARVSEKKDYEAAIRALGWLDGTPTPWEAKRQ